MAKSINLCMEAQFYAEYHKKVREFSRVYIRSFNGDDSTKIDYSQKYKYIPKWRLNAVAKQFDKPYGVSQEFAEEKFKEMKLDYLINEKTTKGKRYKQKWLAIGWYCNSCKIFYHDEDIKQWQHR